MLRLVTLSSPLGGFYCGRNSSCYTWGPLANFTNNFAADIIYTTFIQDLIGPTNYWRDPYNLKDYQEICYDLPDLDNTRNYNEQQKKNFLSIDKLVLFGSPKDGAITPWQSAWFGVWADNSDLNTVAMEDRDVYK